MAKRISFKVDGQVQGVFFRQFTKDQASKLGLSGYVANHSAGHVEGEAQGDESKLKEFVDKLKSGPRHAKVTGVKTSEIDVKDGESGFGTA